MPRLILGLVTNALALWLTTLLVSGVRVDAYDPGVLATVLTYLLVAVIFGVVNAVVGSVVRVVAFPLYILTLGLIAFVVNGLLLLLTAWVSGWFGFGLTVDGFWWGVLGALVFGIVNWLIGVIFRPLLRRERD
ncbi:phage holin family protein [Microbacteriaceae bacterium VKM Ac-2855]|nr:phage holin family protein [Microbacteriaceae bacterium VKM Ac-2855]